MPPSTKPDIQTALAAVMSKLPGIGRDQNAAPGQGGYAYRGIEAITRHVQPLFAEHGVIVVPAVRTVDVKDITVANRPWTDTTLIVDWQIVGPDGSALSATTVGIGRDNSDKGANKAMTQAFKYLLLQLLCVSDSSDDSDGKTHEADQQPEPHPNADRVAHVLEQFKNMTDTQKEALKVWADGRHLSGGSMIRNEAWLETVEAWLAEQVA